MIPIQINIDVNRIYINTNDTMRIMRQMGESEMLCEHAVGYRHNGKCGVVTVTQMVVTVVSVVNGVT